MLEKEKKPYDIILIDIQMPEMDGLQAIWLIRSWLPAGEQPRIAAMTYMPCRLQRALPGGLD